MNARPRTAAAGSTEALGDSTHLDAIIIGAGISGLYALYRLRAAGLRAKIIEAARGIGGTWYWNAYPGARCDAESFDYSYSFSPELEQEWSWSERYASQPEILRYLNYVADKFDLRSDVILDTRVVTASYGEAECSWRLGTNHGVHYTAQFCIAATGTLSAPVSPPFDGLDQYEGDWYETQRWPQEDVKLANRVVGVIGTGSSGIQIIPRLADKAAELMVFQRTPNFSLPARNKPVTADDNKRMKDRYREHRAAQRTSAFGTPLARPQLAAFDLTDEERTAEFERRWAIGGAPSFRSAFTDLNSNPEANKAAADFIRRKIRETVSDAATADLLCPNDHPLGSRRISLDINYYETFNRPNVKLVDVRGDPITRIVRAGIQTVTTTYPVDAIIFALGYDALTGSLMRVDVRGKDGIQLSSEWLSAPAAYLGIAAAGFPNLFMITGPGSPSVLSIMTVAIEQHVEWMIGLIEYLRRKGYRSFEADREAQAAWSREIARTAALTLYPQAASYYNGANISGKPRVFVPYAGGLDVYSAKCEEIARQGYHGFRLA